MKQKFSIEGMSCGHCVARVENAVNELPGIQKVKIHLKRSNGTVKFDEGQVNSEQIAEKINDTGYKAKAV
ncbi:copper chaperone CopZ [Tetragenococcus halophilus subsp. halophilus]|uniref:Copper chaperone CopZ n=1 Tax=Tetragenococcus halophilus (strain DSM 20338 / JCM 20259 / NCIMB 9735 / NBRC 12172) TaxID=945021 RepID=A0AAN1SFK2_TETHN|nr:copper chaperone CopZ [Tetragenococcus halophilus]AOF49380.1 copper-binding protein [Tetragenococcus halophilus]MCO7026004.1 copper chaperone CopZ [Tetragenococcus halophilus]NRR74995.1 copper chaperone CopZ [Tetragenococcus halophilus]NWN98976.1 copper chaperone CopZ [Tetragenococcus halophilus]RQD29264.1 copper chaperone [Tetragenococcus halophilus subsp. halophilus DSM 20339]